MNRVFFGKSVLILGFLLCVLVGGILYTLFQNRLPNAEQYAQALRAKELPPGAPTLPSCAEKISVTETDNKVSAVSFSCADPVMLEDFVRTVKADMLWNVFLFENGSIRIERVVK